MKQQHLIFTLITSFYIKQYKTNDVISNAILHWSNTKIFKFVMLRLKQTISYDNER